MHELDRLYNQDCLEGMASLDAGCVDFILCDLPYGTTQNEWDSVIPLEPLWEQWKRVLKPSGVVALTATQPFTTTLVASNLDWFRYEWIFIKSMVTGHLNAHQRPMRKHEVVLIFSPGAHTYNPQGLKLYGKIKKRGSNGTNYGVSGSENFQQWTNYPTTILEMDFAPKEPKIHPTQKPLALMEYLVLTYSNPEEVVLDSCAGSGSTLVACLNTGRYYIGYELDPEYCKAAQERIENRVDEQNRQPNLDDLFEFES